MSGLDNEKVELSISTNSMKRACFDNHDGVIRMPHINIPAVITRSDTYKQSHVKNGSGNPYLNSS